ncbi:MAG: radical SAM protein [Acidobacteriia bacterium]|nr:radical SAM protein [Terriglobia bacterium]
MRQTITKGTSRRQLVAVTKKIEGALISESPDAAALCREVRNELVLGEDEARRFLRRIVLDLNAAYFPAINTVDLMMTDRCTLACTYCFERRMTVKHEMTAETARAAVDFLVDYSGKAEKLYLCLFGGEPLMNFGVMQDCVAYAGKRVAAAGKKVRFDITTNGTLLTEETLDFFAAHGILPLLSVDGLAESHDSCRVDHAGNGSFARVGRAIELVFRKHNYVGVRMTVMPRNVPRFYDDIVGLHKLGVRSFLVGAAIGSDWPDDLMDFYGSELRRVLEWRDREAPKVRLTGDFEGKASHGVFGCRAGRNAVTVSTTGEISACATILGLNSVNLVKKLGDVEFGLTHFRHRFEFATAFRVKENCEKCGIAADYPGGCYANNYEETGDLYLPSLGRYRFEKIRCSHGLVQGAATQ